LSCSDGFKFSGSICTCSTCPNPAKWVGSTICRLVCSIFSDVRCCCSGRIVGRSRVVEINRPPVTFSSIGWYISDDSSRFGCCSSIENRLYLSVCFVS
jgi:hypothetical protein